MKSQKPENLITVLDAGSTKSVVLVAELHEAYGTPATGTTFSMRLLAPA